MPLFTSPQTHLSLLFTPVRNLYPGIDEHCRYTLIIGRNTSSLHGKDLASYKSMVIGSETDIDVYTYDEFIKRTIEAFIRLETIRIGQ